MADPEYFTLADFRTLPDMDDDTKYTDAAVLRAAAYITSIIEREVGTSFIAREVADEPHDGGSTGIVLNTSYVLGTPTATEDGNAVTDTLTVRFGLLQRFTPGSYSPNRWGAGIGNVLVTYDAGYSTTPPADVSEAAMQGTRARLLDTVSSARGSDRRRSISNDAGGTTEFVLAGADRPTGYPDVDAVIIGWRTRLAGPGVA